MRGGRPAITALLTFVVGLAVIVTGSVALARSRPAPGPAAALSSTTREPSATRDPKTPKIPLIPVKPAASVATQAPVAAPVALTIPAIGVSTPLIRLGLTSAGTLQVPDRFDVAGWYDRSPRPGAIGPAVIAGHIDNVNGPAVFYRLGLLGPGDQVDVRRADGTVAVFQVTHVGLYPKDRFPTAAVYGATPGPELRLITCGGAFDWSRHSYLSNVVVYAAEVS
jgi:sortase (surface protein transpeptidase)